MGVHGQLATQPYVRAQSIASDLLTVGSARLFGEPERSAGKALPCSSSHRSSASASAKVSRGRSSLRICFSSPIIGASKGRSFDCRVTGQAPRSVSGADPAMRSPRASIHRLTGWLSRCGQNARERINAETAGLGPALVPAQA